MLAFRNTVEVLRIHKGIEYRHFAHNDITAAGIAAIRNRLFGLSSEAALGSDSRLDIARAASPPTGSADILSQPLVTGTGFTNLTDNPTLLRYYFSINTGNINNFVAFPTPTLHLKPAMSATAGDGAWFEAAGADFMEPITSIEADMIYNVAWSIQQSGHMSSLLSPNEVLQVAHGNALNLGTISPAGSLVVDYTDSIRTFHNLLAGVGSQSHFASCRMRMCRPTDAAAATFIALRADPTVSAQDVEYAGEWLSSAPGLASETPPLPPFIHPLFAPGPLAEMEAAETVTGTVAAHATDATKVTAALTLQPITNGLYAAARWYALELIPDGTVSDTNKIVLADVNYLAEHLSNAFGRTDVDVRLVRSRPAESDIEIDLTVS